MASLAPQFTEHPPQLPRGVEGAALQEFPWSASAVPGSVAPALCGGPV